MRTDPTSRSAKAAYTKTVDRAIDLLEALGTQARPLRLSELSRSVGLDKATTYRLVKTWTRRGFVMEDPETRTYRLGLGVAKLASSASLQSDSIFGECLRQMRTLYELSGESVNAHVIAGTDRIVIFEIESPNPIRMVAGLGNRYPLVSGAAGKALLAALSDDRLEQVLTAASLRVGERKANVDNLRREIPVIRQRGWAVSFGETVQGAAAIAAAAVGGDGEPLLAINVTGPDWRWTRQRMEQVIDPLLTAIRQVIATPAVTRRNRTVGFP